MNSLNNNNPNKIQVLKLGCFILLTTENLEPVNDIKQTSIERTMSIHGSMEKLANRSSSADVEREVPESQMLKQEAVNEQIRGFVAPLTRQLEELTRLLQGMTTSRHPNSYPRTQLGTTSGTAMPQSDILINLLYAIYYHLELKIFAKNSFFLKKNPKFLVEKWRFQKIFLLETHSRGHLL